MPRTVEKPSILMRVIYALPIIGLIARDIAKDPDAIFYALVIFVTIVVLAVKFWGLVALTMTALLLVPVIFILLILISVG
tara:strand:- start:144 stop:383 length:240 start_codon:yes stop_codon:yes gene_type:complete